VTPRYIQGVRAAGFPDITLSQLVEFRIHGIDKEYIDYVKGLLQGKEVTARKIVSMKIHGI
jgi:hypothetical protein